MAGCGTQGSHIVLALEATALGQARSSKSGLVQSASSALDVSQSRPVVRRVVLPSAPVTFTSATTAPPSGGKNPAVAAVAATQMTFVPATNSMGKRVIVPQNC